MDRREQKRQRKAKERERKKRVRAQQSEGRPSGGLMGMRRGFKAVTGAGASKKRFWDVVTWIAIGLAAIVFVMKRCS